MAPHHLLQLSTTTLTYLLGLYKKQYIAFISPCLGFGPFWLFYRMRHPLYSIYIIYIIPHILVFPTYRLYIHIYRYIQILPYLILFYIILSYLILSYLILSVKKPQKPPMHKMRNFQQLCLVVYTTACLAQD